MPHFRPPYPQDGGALGSGNAVHKLLQSQQVTFLSNTDDASVALRKLVLESCNLHTVLDCPSGTFHGAGVKTVVLFRIAELSERTRLRPDDTIVGTTC